MDRRQFNRLSALSLAALAARSTPLLAQTGTQTGKPVGYALIGLGTISDIFGRACLKSKGAKVTALVTGHGDTKGKEWAARYGVPESSIYSYETFDKLRENKDVDAVYVGLPNSMHREFTVRAAAAGKHVLCEKPMAISSAECREMIAACKAANVRLMIAYRCHFDPCHLEAERVIQAGLIGEIQAFEGSFGFDATKGVWRLDPKLAGGGPIMDVGIYPLNSMRFFSREDPTAFTAVTATRDHGSGKFAGMEESMDWTMEFPSGIIASLGTTYGAGMPGILRIHGTRGTLELAPAFDYTGIHLRGFGSAKDVKAASSDDQTAHFQLEAEYFAHCVRTGETPSVAGEEGLKDLLAIEAIYRAAGHPIA